MTASPEKPHKRYSLFVLALVLGAIAAAAFLVTPDSFPVRSFGVLALLMGVWLVRASRVRTRSAAAARASERAGGGAASQPGRSAWVLGGGSLLAAGASYALMYTDALHGGRHVWPAYLFAGAATACAVSWGYLASKMLK